MGLKTRFYFRTSALFYKLLLLLYLNVPFSAEVVNNDFRTSALFI